MLPKYNPEVLENMQNVPASSPYTSSHSTPGSQPSHPPLENPFSSAETTKNNNSNLNFNASIKRKLLGRNNARAARKASQEGEASEGVFDTLIEHQKTLEKQRAVDRQFLTR